jgi:(2Fe-2S) ferredoxin
MNYPFEKLFLVCIGARCNDEKHAEERGECIAEDLKHVNKKLGRKPDVRVCRVSCLDLCDHGPNMVVQPGGTVYSHLNLEKARAAYAGVMGDGPLRPDLELDRREFEAGASAAVKRT